MVALIIRGVDVRNADMYVTMAWWPLVAAGGRLTDWVSLGVLASAIPRDAVARAIAAAGRSLPLLSMRAIPDRTLERRPH
jgi:hypothetical protein